jgi:hypothetical protein
LSMPGDTFARPDSASWVDGRQSVRALPAGALRNRHRCLRTARRSRGTCLRWGSGQMRRRHWRTGLRCTRSTTLEYRGAGGRRRQDAWEKDDRWQRLALRRSCLVAAGAASSPSWAPKGRSIATSGPDAVPGSGRGEEAQLLLQRRVFVQRIDHGRARSSPTTPATATSGRSGPPTAVPPCLPASTGRTPPHSG